MSRSLIEWLFRHALEGWLPTPLHPLDVIRGAILLNGSYELE